MTTKNTIILSLLGVAVVSTIIYMKKEKDKGKKSSFTGERTWSADGEREWNMEGSSYASGGTSTVSKDNQCYNKKTGAWSTCPTAKSFKSATFGTSPATR